MLEPLVDTSGLPLEGIQGNTKIQKGKLVLKISSDFLGSDFGRMDFPRTFIFGPPDFFADFLADFFSSFL